jgi:hypothetical protein
MPRFPLRLGLALAGVAFLSLVVTVTVAIGDDGPAPEPVAGIKNIMNALNSDKHGLFAQIKEFCTAGGGEAEQWKLMRDRANVIAEGGNILMSKSPPRGADDAAGMLKWKQHCAAFRDAVKHLSRALAYKKVPKVQAAIQAVTVQCDSCHKEHRSN